MTVTIRCEAKPAFSFHYRDLAKRIVRTVLDAEGFPGEAEVSLVLTDNRGIRKLNRSLRGIDAATDVLSFPMIPFARPADYSVLHDQWEIDTDPETGEVLLGDIALSVDKVRVQAKKYGHSERREYAFLLVHSMLHLLGYDHEDPGERAGMEERQERILAKLNITR